MEEEEEDSDTGEDDENVYSQEEDFDYDEDENFDDQQDEKSTKKSDMNSAVTSHEEPADDDDDRIKETKVTGELASNRTNTSSNRTSKRSSERSLEKTSENISPAVSYEEPADDEDDSIKKIKLTGELASNKTYTSSNRTSRRSSRRILDRRRSKSLQDLVGSSSSSESCEVGNRRRKRKDLLSSSISKSNSKSRSELPNKVLSNQSRSKSSSVTKNSKKTESKTISPGSRFSQLSEIDTDILPKIPVMEEDQSMVVGRGNSSLTSTNSVSQITSTQAVCGSFNKRSSKSSSLNKACELRPKELLVKQASHNPLTSAKLANEFPPEFPLQRKTSSLRAYYMGEQYARSASMTQTTHLPGIFGIPKVRESKSKTFGCWQLDSPVLSQLNNKDLAKATMSESSTARKKFPTSETDLDEADKLKQGDYEEGRRLLLPAIWTSSIAVFDKTDRSKQDYVKKDKSLSSLPPSANPPPTCKPTSTTGLGAYIAHREQNKYNVRLPQGVSSDPTLAKLRKDPGELGRTARRASEAPLLAIKKYQRRQIRSKITPIHLKRSFKSEHADTGRQKTSDNDTSSSEIIEKVVVTKVIKKPSKKQKKNLPKPDLGAILAKRPSDNTVKIRERIPEVRKEAGEPERTRKPWPYDAHSEHHLAGRAGVLQHPSLINKQVERRSSFENMLEKRWALQREADDDSKITPFLTTVGKFVYPDNAIVIVGKIPLPDGTFKKTVVLGTLHAKPNLDEEKVGSGDSLVTLGSSGVEAPVAIHPHEEGESSIDFDQVDTAIEPVFEPLVEGQKVDRERQNIRQFMRRMSKDLASKTKTLGHNLTEKGNAKFRKISGMLGGFGKHMDKSKRDEIQEDVAFKLAEHQEHEVRSMMSEDSAFYSSDDEDVDEAVVEHRYGEKFVIGRDNRSFPASGKRRVHRSDILWHVPQKTNDCLWFTEHSLNRKMRELRIEIRRSTDMNVKKWRVRQEGWIGGTGSKIQIDSANESGDFTVESLLENSKPGEAAMSEIAAGLRNLATESRHDILSRRYKFLLKNRSLAVNSDYLRQSLSRMSSYGKSLSKSSSFMSARSVQKALKGLVNLGSKFKQPDKIKSQVSSHIYDEVASGDYINAEEAGIVEGAIDEAEWETDEKEDDSDEEDSEYIQQAVAGEIEGAMYGTESGSTNINDEEQEDSEVEQEEDSDDLEQEEDSDYIKQAVAGEVEGGMEMNYSSSIQDMAKTSDEDSIQDGEEETESRLDESNTSGEQLNNSNTSNSNDIESYSSYDAITPLPSARPQRRTRKNEKSSKKAPKEFTKKRTMVTIGGRRRKVEVAPSSSVPLQTLQSKSRASKTQKGNRKTSGLQRSFSTLSFNSSYSESVMRNNTSRVTRGMNGLSQQTMTRQLKSLEKGKKKTSAKNLTSLEPRCSKSFPSYDDLSLEEEMCQIRKGISRHWASVGSCGDTGVSGIYSRSLIPTRKERDNLLRGRSFKRTKTERKFKWRSENNLVVIGNHRELRKVKNSLKSFTSHVQKSVPTIRTGPSTQDYSEAEDDTESQESTDDSGEAETEKSSRRTVEEYEISQTKAGEVTAAVYDDPSSESKTNEESMGDDQEQEFAGDEETEDDREEEGENDEVDDQDIDEDVNQIEDSSEAWSTTDEEEEKSSEQIKNEKDLDVRNSFGTELKQAVDEWQKKKIDQIESEVHYDQPSDAPITRPLSVTQNSPTNSEVPGFPGSVRVTPTTSQYNNLSKIDKKTTSNSHVRRKSTKKNRASAVTTPSIRYSVPELARFFESYQSLREHKHRKKETETDSTTWPRSRMFRSYPGKYNLHSRYGPSQSLTTIRSEEELDEFGDPIPKPSKHFPRDFVRLAPSDFSTTNVSDVTTWWGDDEKRPSLKKYESGDDDWSIYTAVGSEQKPIRSVNEADIKASMSSRSIISKASMGFRAAMMYLRGDGLLLKRFMKKDYKKKSTPESFKFKLNKGPSSLKIICKRKNDRLQATAERSRSGLCLDPDCMYHVCPNSSDSSSNDEDICNSCEESKSWPCTRKDTEPLNVTMEDVKDFLQTGERNPDIYDLNVIPSVPNSGKLNECPECPCQGRKFRPFFPELFEKNALVPLAERIVELAMFEGQEKYNRLYPLYTERDEDKLTDKIVYDVIVLGVAKFTVQDAFRSTLLDLESEEMFEILTKEVIRDLGKNTMAEFISENAIAQARRQLIVKEFIKSSEPDRSSEEKNVDQEQAEIWRYTLGDRDPDKFISFCPPYPGEPRTDGIIPIAIPHVDKEAQKKFYQPIYIQSKIKAKKLLNKVFKTSYNRFLYPPSEYATASETSLAIPQEILNERILLDVSELLDDMISVVVMADEINLDLTGATTYMNESVIAMQSREFMKNTTVEEDVLFIVNKMAWSVAISEELKQGWAEVAEEDDTGGVVGTDGDNDDNNSDHETEPRADQSLAESQGTEDDNEQNGTEETENNDVVPPTSMRARSAMSLKAIVRKVKERRRPKADKTHKNKGLIGRFFKKLFESRKRESKRIKDTISTSSDSDKQCCSGINIHDGTIYDSYSSSSLSWDESTDPRSKLILVGMRSPQFWGKQIKGKGIDIKMPKPSSGVTYIEESEPDRGKGNERKVFGSVPRFMLTKFGNIAQHLTSPRKNNRESKEKSKNATPFPSGVARSNVSDDMDDDYVYFIPISRANTGNMTTCEAVNVPSTYEDGEDVTGVTGEKSPRKEGIENFEGLHPSGGIAHDYSSSSFNSEISPSNTTMSTTMTLPSETGIKQELIYHPTISGHQVDNLALQSQPLHEHRDTDSSSLSLHDEETFQYSTYCTSNTSISMKTYDVVGRDFNETRIGKNKDKKKTSDSCPLEFPPHIINIGKSNHRVSGWSGQNVGSDTVSSDKKSILVRIGKREEMEKMENEDVVLRDSSSSTVKIRTIYADYNDPDYEAWGYNSHPSSNQHDNVLLVPMNERELEANIDQDCEEEESVLAKSGHLEPREDNESDSCSDRELGDEEIIANVRKMFKPSSPANIGTDTAKKHDALKPATGTCDEKVAPVRDFQESSVFKEVWEIAEACKTQLSNLLELKTRSYNINTEVAIQPELDQPPTNQNLANFDDLSDRIMKSPGKEKAGKDFRMCSFNKAPLVLDHPASREMNHVCCNANSYTTQDLIKDLNMEMTSIKKMMKGKQRPCRIKPRRNTDGNSTGAFEDSSENSSVLNSLSSLQQTLGEFAKVIDCSSSSFCKSKIVEKKNEDKCQNVSFSDSLSDLYKFRQRSIKGSNKGQEQNEISRLKFGQSSICNRNRVTKDRLKRYSSNSNLNLLKKQGNDRKIPKVEAFTLGRTGHRSLKIGTVQKNGYSDNFSRCNSYRSTFSHPSIAKLTQMSTGFTYNCSADETSSDSDVSSFSNKESVDSVYIDSAYDSRLRKQKPRGNVPLPSGLKNPIQQKMVVIGSRGRRRVHMPSADEFSKINRKIILDKSTQTKKISVRSNSADSSSTSNSSSTIAGKRKRQKFKIQHSNRKPKKKSKGVEQNNKKLNGTRNQRIQTISDQINEKNIDENERLRLLRRKYELSDSVSSFCSNYTTPGEPPPRDEYDDMKSSLTVISSFSSEEQNTVRKSRSRTHGEITPSATWLRPSSFPKKSRNDVSNPAGDSISSSDTNLSVALDTKCDRNSEDSYGELDDRSEIVILNRQKAQTTAHLKNNKPENIQLPVPVLTDFFETVEKEKKEEIQGGNVASVKPLTPRSLRFMKSRQEQERMVYPSAKRAPQRKAGKRPSKALDSNAVNQPRRTIMFVNRSNVAEKKESEEVIEEESEELFTEKSEEEEELAKQSEPEMQKQQTPAKLSDDVDMTEKNSEERDGRTSQERERMVQGRERRMSAWDRIMSQTPENIFGTSSIPRVTTDDIPGPSNISRRVKEQEEVRPAFAENQESRPPEFRLIAKKSRVDSSTVDFLTGIPSFFESGPNRQSLRSSRKSNDAKRSSFCFTCENNKRRFPSSSSDTGPENIRTLARRLKDRGNEKDARLRPVPVKLFPKTGRIGRVTPMHSCNNDCKNVQMFHLGRNRTKRALKCNVQKMLNPTFSDIRKTRRSDMKSWNLGQSNRRQRRFTSPDFRRIARARKSSTSEASVSDFESNVRVVYRSNLANLTPKPSKTIRFQPITSTQVGKSVKVGRGKVERQANAESRVDEWLRDSVAVRSKELITRTAGSVLKFLQGFSMVRKDNQKTKRLRLEDPRSRTLQLGRFDRYDKDIPMTSCGANRVDSVQKSVPGQQTRTSDNEDTATKRWYLLPSKSSLLSLHKLSLDAVSKIWGRHERNETPFQTTVSRTLLENIQETSSRFVFKRAGSILDKIIRMVALLIVIYFVIQEDIFQFDGEVPT